MTKLSKEFPAESVSKLFVNNLVPINMPTEVSSLEAATKNPVDV